MKFCTDSRRPANRVGGEVRLDMRTYGVSDFWCLGFEGYTAGTLG
jgi:hypothetical protein